MTARIYREPDARRYNDAPREPHTFRYPWKWILGEQGTRARAAQGETAATAAAGAAGDANF